MLSNDQIPKKYLCPITYQIMVDPVVAADGYTYEKEAIAQWLWLKPGEQSKSPITGLRLEHTDLTDNRDKRSEVVEFLDNHPELYEEGKVYLPESWKAQCAKAIKENQRQKVQRWLDKDRRLLTVKLEGNYTALHFACKFSSPELVDAILETLKQRNQSIMPGAVGFKAVHLNVLLERALNSGDYEKCELLLRLEAEVEQPETCTQNTLLHRTVIKENFEAVNWLLEQKAFLESRNTEGNTPLLLAVQQGNAKLVDFLLKMNANPEVKNAQRKTAIYVAVEKSCLEVTRLLIARGASVNCEVARSTLLHIASAKGDLATLKLLLQTKAKALVDAMNVNGDTPLHLAVQSGHDAPIPILLKSGACHKIRNEQDQTPVELARAQQKRKTANFIVQTAQEIKKAKLKETGKLHQLVSEQASEIALLKTALVKTSGLKSALENQERCFKMQLSEMQDQIKLLQSTVPKAPPPSKPLLMFSPATSLDQATSLELVAKEKQYAADTHVNTQKTRQKERTKSGVTSIYIAAQNGHTEVIAALKAAGVNVDTPREDGWTPVFIAAYNGHADTIRALKAAGANMNTFCDGATAVYIAAQNGHAEAITALKAAGANVDTPKDDGWTPVFIAAYDGHVEAIRALQAAGANVDTIIGGGITPVFTAAQNGHAGAITALNAAGADVNMPENNGVTPVFIAAQNGHAEAITALKAAGADVDTPENNGVTPVFIAAYNGHAEAIAALKAAGANVNTPGGNGMTPVYIAAKNGHTRVIAALQAAGASMNTPDNDGETPAFIAAQNNHADVIAALQAAGANMYRRVTA